MMVVVSGSTVRGDLQQATGPALKLAIGVDLGNSGSKKVAYDALGTVDMLLSSVDGLVDITLQDVLQNVAGGQESAEAGQNNNDVLGDTLKTIAGSK